MEDQQIQCLGFIMDGNRRWAKEQNIPSYEGHKKGSDVLNEYIQYVSDANIPHAVFYAFSTENWNRSSEEVAYLMELFREYLRDIKQKLDNDEASLVHIRIVGRREDFPQDIQDQMVDLEEQNKKDSDINRTTIWLALSYGGRAELITAINQAIKNGVPVDETSFESFLWTADMPDPDMIIRTSGEHRLSNFMTWRSVYSEFYFLEKHWPALTRDDFQDILQEYNRRNRRKGT